MEKFPAQEPNYAVPPGWTLAEYIGQQRLLLTTFAEKGGFDPQFLHDFVEGDVELDGDLAISLEKTTGIPARLWLRMEEDYRRAKKRLGEG